ncbi:N2,N2-dimethylguanosine tRNA methyltransferase [Meredithblackwellia eburnea MCA 4105]
MTDAATPMEVEKKVDSTEVETGGESARPAPAGFVVHTESTTSILFASPTTTGPAPVFLNPVQEYNRDLSVAAIRTWATRRAREKTVEWEKGLKKRKAKRMRKEGEGEGENGDSNKKRKLEDGGKQETEKVVAEDEVVDDAEEGVKDQPKLSTEDKLPRTPLFKFTLLEALSATGLRAIRYAKELPLLRYVVANDLSASAVEDIKRNVEWNGLAPKGLPPAEEEAKRERPRSKAEIDELLNGKVRPNEGDAVVYMYNHRSESSRFDCIDLDPYGSAVPFLDAAIGAVADGGLMCVTCTDAAVLAGHNYPEKSYTHYGGVCVNSEYSHEVGIRLILNAIASTAGRYGRTIEPLLSLSIDFYMRVFLRVTTSPKEVKALPSKTSLLYYCHDCQAHFMQPMGKVVEKVSAKTGDVNYSYHMPAGPPAGMGERCGECGGRFHIGGPMWGAPIHNQEFVAELLEHVENNMSDFGTASRITGMISIAKAELEAPFYFTPAKLAGFFHTISPPLNTIASALLNGGFQISRSHTVAGSIKTNAPRDFIMDIYREWIKSHPVNMDKVKEGSPAARLLAKEQKHEISLEPHPGVDEAMMSKHKLVRYQLNPLPNWGPGKAAVRGKGKKSNEQD